MSKMDHMPAVDLQGVTHLLLREEEGGRASETGTLPHPWAGGSQPGNPGAFLTLVPLLPTPFAPRTRTRARTTTVNPTEHSGLRKAHAHGICETTTSAWP